MKNFLGLKLPIFMPDATLGAVRSITTEQLKETGTEMVVVNTLHLLLSYGPETMSKLRGIRKLMNWDGLVLSDSGGFQAYSLIHRSRRLGKVTQYGACFTSPHNGEKTVLTPEKSIDMQIAIGSDVLIVLDDCRFSEISRKEAENSVKYTVNWAARSKKHFTKEYPKESKSRKIFAVVQGGNYEDLRKKCASELQEIRFDGYCFGGWPIDSDKNLVVDILKCVSDALPSDKPKYAMGIGKPDDIRTCYNLGYNMFDCVIPTRNARHGLLYTRKGEVRISDAAYTLDESPVDSDCRCNLCQNYSRAYLHHLFRAKEITAKSLATIHNLTYYSDLIDELRKT